MFVVINIVNTIVNIVINIVNVNKSNYGYNPAYFNESS